MELSLDQQLAILCQADKDLRSAGIPITGIYMPSEENDAGIEIDGKYTIHIAPYCEPGIFMSEVKSPEIDIAQFSTINGLIAFIMEDT